MSKISLAARIARYSAVRVHGSWPDVLGAPGSLDTRKRQAKVNGRDGVPRALSQHTCVSSDVPSAHLANSLQGRAQGLHGLGQKACMVQ